MILAAAISVNVYVNARHLEIAESFPFIGIAVWGALLAMMAWRRSTWGLLHEAAKGSILRLSLVLSATIMPVERLPVASWQTAMDLGFLVLLFTLGWHPTPEGDAPAAHAGVEASTVMGATAALVPAD